MPCALQNCARVNCLFGPYRSDHDPRDFRSIPFGISFSQLCIGMPKTRCSSPRPLKWAAIDNPYGPAPITDMFVLFGTRRFLLVASNSRHLSDRLAYTTSRCTNDMTKVERLIL